MSLVRTLEQKANMNFFQRLTFKRYTTEFGENYTELNEYADFTFENGISIRVSTGMMAESTFAFPYEAMVKMPHKDPKNYPYLSRSGLDNLMNLLHVTKVVH